MCADPAPRVAHRLLVDSETAPVHVQIAWLGWPARVGSARHAQVLRRQRSGRTSGWPSDEGSAFSPSRREPSPVHRENQPPRARLSTKPLARQATSVRFEAFIFFMIFRIWTL